MEALIKEVAKKLNLNEELVEDVVKYQFEFISKSVAQPYIKSIEVTGLFKMKVRPNKIIPQLERINNIIKDYHKKLADPANEPIREKLLKKLNMAEAEKEFLESKQDENKLKADSRSIKE